MKYSRYRQRTHCRIGRVAGAPLAPVGVVSTRLLVVEDDSSTNFAIRAFFRSIGYDVDAVSDAASATRLLDEERYDVVITDLQLRRSDTNDGMAIVSHTRQRHANACIIMLTAFGTAAALPFPRRRGVDLFRAKPVALRDLHLFIEKILRRDEAAAGLPAREH
jgi:DNA-binding response OmpR family regulator